MEFLSTLAGLFGGGGGAPLSMAPLAAGAPASMELGAPMNIMPAAAQGGGAAPAAGMLNGAAGPAGGRSNSLGQMGMQMLKPQQQGQPPGLQIQMARPVGPVQLQPLQLPGMLNQAY